MRKTVYWIEGDGIGPDVWKSARPVIDEAIRLSYGDERGFDWKELLAGEKALKETGTLLPDETLAALRGAELAIKGPLGTPVGTGFRSLNVGGGHLGRGHVHPAPDPRPLRLHPAHPLL